MRVTHHRRVMLLVLLVVSLAVHLGLGDGAETGSRSDSSDAVVGTVGAAAMAGSPSTDTTKQPSPTSTTDRLTILRIENGTTNSTNNVTALSRVRPLNFLGGRNATQLPSLGGSRDHVALLLQSRENVTDQLQGCIAIAIARQYFLTRANCLWERLNAPSLVIEFPHHRSNNPIVIPAPATNDSSRSNSSVISSRHQRLTILSNTTHPDEGVNLAILRIDDRELPRGAITPITLASINPRYYRSERPLTFFSLDNLFNPTLEHNPKEISSLIRVPMASCEPSLELDDGGGGDGTQCYTPTNFRQRETPFEFGQGLLAWGRELLVGLPDCTGLCGGGMFYSATHLATHREWIDEVTNKAARWFAPPTLQSRKIITSSTNSGDPSYVSLYSSNLKDPVCGGALIAPKYVLTSASCVKNRTIHSVHVGLGVRPKQTTLEEDILPVVGIHPHPGFGNKTEFSDDLAVIALQGPTFYPPTLIVSEDDYIDAPRGPCKPNVSPEDRSVLCTPPIEDHDCDVDTAGVTRLNGLRGDAVFATQAERVHIVGIGFGASFDAEEDEMLASFVCGDSGHGGANATTRRRSFVARLGTPETVAFINDHSVDHTWMSLESFFSFLETPRLSARMMPRRSASPTVGNVSALPVVVDPFTGALKFETPSSGARLGFVVGLRVEKFGRNFCGGSLISSSYVLTAAHCVQRNAVNYVAVGSRESSGEEAELISVRDVTTHPKYGVKSMFSHDVAIIELDTPAYPAPIALDNGIALDPSTYLTLYGYGANSAGSMTLSDHLRSVALPYFPRDKCKANFPQLDESMFCAGGELARDACTGDSGSPLVVYQQDNRPVLVGVVSSGRSGCGTPGVPGIYAQVAEVQSFIDAVSAGQKWLNRDRRAAPMSLATAPTGGHDNATSGNPGSSGGGEERGGHDENPADGTVMRSSAFNGTLPFEVVKMANGSVSKQLSIIELADSTPTRFEQAVMRFLVGQYRNIAMWAPLSRYGDMRMWFYSTGNLSGLMEIIARHKARPLYARRNRFGQPIGLLRDDEWQSTAASSCHHDGNRSHS